MGKGFGHTLLVAAAGLELKARPHMLRNTCGYALANRGRDKR
jgi:hypothetical protein